MEPLSVAIHSVSNISQLRTNQTVVVFGAGPVGLLCMAVARALGAARVVAVDIVPARLEFAKAYAATDAYPDRAMHYGLPAFDGFGAEAHHAVHAHAQAEYAGLDFPPNAQVAYDPAQYAGYVGGYGAGYEDQQYVLPQHQLEQQYAQQQQYAYAGQQQQQQLTQPPVERVRSPNSPHPYADPSNMAHAVGAPPVQQYYMPRDEVVYTGEAH